MRSELVFAANDQVVNRFKLCQLVSRSARIMHKSTISIHQTINEVLVLMGETQLEPSVAPAPLPETV